MHSNRLKRREVITLAAKAATVLTVFTIASNTVKIGLVANLNRPGGNVMGVTNLIVEVAPKRLQWLHELLPTASVVALLVNAADCALAQAQASELLA